MMYQARVNGIGCIIESKPWLDTVEIRIVSRDRRLTPDGDWVENLPTADFEPWMVLDRDVFAALAAAIQDEGEGLGDTSALADARKLRDRILALHEKCLEQGLRPS